MPDLVNAVIQPVRAGEKRAPDEQETGSGRSARRSVVPHREEIRGPEDAERPPAERRESQRYSRAHWQAQPGSEAGLQQARIHSDGGRMSRGVMTRNMADPS